MTKTGNFRDRITQDCYLGKKSDDPTGRMEIAFNEFNKILPILKKLKKFGLKQNSDIEGKLKSILANKILTPAEVEQFLRAKKFQQDAMQVDAF